MKHGREIWGGDSGHLDSYGIVLSLRAIVCVTLRDEYNV